jgi:Restriction endonuclease NotI
VETIASAFARAVLVYWAIVWMASIQIPRLSEFGETHSLSEKWQIPSESFGYPFSNETKKAADTRSKHWCPFVDKVCYKQSRLIRYPFGVCSAHVNNDEVALCPRRFLDGHAVFTDIAQHHFKTINDILVFPEIRLKDIGSFDFVMLKHKPMSFEIEDFVAIEFQTGQTTGTGKLVEGLKDYLARKSVSEKSYGFGLNLADVWKRSFTQILNKGVIMENWGKKIYWVVQEPVYLQVLGDTIQFEKPGSSA